MGVYAMQVKYLMIDYSYLALPHHMNRILKQTYSVFGSLTFSVESIQVFYTESIIGHRPSS